MKVETIEWIGKAEGDIRTSQREFSVNEHPNYDAVCFHAQQCAEKYLKALLVEKALPVPRTHDLEVLLSSIIGVYPEITSLLRFARILSSMAVEVRYPGICTDKDDACEALRSAEAIRIMLRGILGV